MTNKAALPAGTKPVDRLFAEVVRRLGKNLLSGFVRPFAEKGDLGVLRLILDSGQVGSDKNDILLLASVIPVLGAVPDSEKALAKQLVADWRCVFEPIDSGKLDFELATSQDSARDLIALGANPNGFANSARTVTALGRTFTAKNFSAARVMLQALAERDEMPMQAYNVAPGAKQILSGRLAASSGENGEDITYFRGLLEWIGSSAPNPTTRDIAKHITEMLRSIDMPRAWRQEIGASFMMAVEKNEFQKDGGRAQVFGELLLHAEFHSGADLVKAVSLFAEDLRKEDCVGIVAALSNKLLEMGAHPDQILVPAVGEVRQKTASTWLQAAAFFNQAEMVKRLLEAGADPTYRSPDGTGMDAYELAQQRAPEALVVLASWRAKTAVGSVLRDAGRTISPDSRS